MSQRKEVVETYFEGFRRSDNQQVVACLTDKFVWDIPGHTYKRGKDAFDLPIECRLRG